MCFFVAFDYSVEAMTWLLVRYGEIWLKGKKRSFFERTLMHNIKKCLDAGKHPYQRIVRKPGRVLVETPAMYPSLARLPGVVSFSLAYKTEPTKEAVFQTINELVPASGKSFCVRVKRLEKIGQSSQEWERQIGTYVVAGTGKKVDLENPEVTLGVELFRDAAFVFLEHVVGCGGLPQVKEGRIVLLLQTEKDLLAGKLLLKRGCIPDIYSPAEALYTALITSSPGIPLQRVSHFVDCDFIAAGNAKENSPCPVLLPLEGLTEEEIATLGGR